MVTPTPDLTVGARQMAAERVRLAALTSIDPPRPARLADVVRRVLCGIRGHDTLLHFEDERMALRCVSCGHESPGWTLDAVPPTVTVRGDVRRHAPPALISARRLA